MKVLVTCPPMLGMIDEFRDLFNQKDIELITPTVTQTLSVEELKTLVPKVDGWIIGDDPATRAVFEAGKAGNLKAAVKWGIGVDNVDFDACKDLNIPIINTPLMFGAEVADVALSFIIGLARQTYFIDREIRQNNAWPKPAGISLANKNIGIIGFGDIGKNVAKRVLACEMNVTVYDPSVTGTNGLELQRQSWPENIELMDFLVFTCSLNDQNLHMLDASILEKAKQGVYIVNVARGPLINEADLIQALQSGKVFAAALDVFEEEPLPKDSPLRALPQCIFGSHNGSNTQDAVIRASHEAIKRLFNFLNV